MKILLVGHGRMGRLIEQTVIRSDDMEIAHIIDIDNLDDFDSLGKVSDVIVDFSHPDMLPYLDRYVRRTHTPLLCGTTAYSEKEEEVFRKLGEVTAVVHSSNYSLGIAVFRRVLEQISPVFKDDFDIEIIEKHHNQKIDAPSGTAKLLLDTVDPHHEYTPIYGRAGMCGVRNRSEIGIHAIRGGTVAGEHTVSFFGENEIFEITHKAENRGVFVTGALKAAKVLSALPAKYYTLDELLFGEKK